MPPKLIALGVIAIVLWIVMMIVAPPQDTTHYSADAGDFAAALHNICLIKQRVTGPWAASSSLASGQGWGW